MVVIVTYIICFFFFITLAMFFAFHLWLVVNAMTTIEYREKSHYQHTFRASHIKFDYGYYQNFVHIFGPPWMWFLPISPPADHFLTLQYDFVRSLPPCKNENNEIERQRLLTFLKSKDTHKEYIRNEAGSYYTPLPEKFQLWKLSVPELSDVPDEKPSIRRRGVGGGNSQSQVGENPIASPIGENEFATTKKDKSPTYQGEVGGERDHAVGVGLSSEDDGEESEEDIEGGGVPRGDDEVGVMIRGHGGESGGDGVQAQAS
jgi:hypothetical protein